MIDVTPTKLTSKTNPIHNTSLQSQLKQDNTNINQNMLLLLNKFHNYFQLNQLKTYQKETTIQESKIIEYYYN